MVNPMPVCSFRSRIVYCLIIQINHHTHACTQIAKKTHSVLHPLSLLPHFPLQRSKIPLERRLHRLHPHIPDIFTARPCLILDSLLAVMVTDDPPAFPIPIRPGAHAEPEVLPVFAARPQLTIAVDVHELAPE